MKVEFTRWPVWRLLVWLEVWLLGVAGFHLARTIHDQFVVPLLIATVPAGVVVAFWAFARGATGQKPTGQERASALELLIAATAAVAAAGWTIAWAREAREDLARVDVMFGQATIIIDVSVTWLAVGACVAALTLDGVLSIAHARLRHMMTWLRRTHLAITVVQIGLLFAAAWVFTQLPDAGTAANAAFFERARIALHVYEYCRATIFPVQAFFAAMALAIAAADNYAD